jgi:hypothetical protein
MKKKIIIELTDNRDELRNSGLGDYFIRKDGVIIIRAFMKDKHSYNKAWLIAVHELVEQRLTQFNYLSEPEIDAYDRMIVEKGGVADEAGNEPDCPYKYEHRFAENIERQLALALGIDWNEYYNYYI